MSMPQSHIARRAQLLEEVPSPVVVIDRSRVIVDHNRAFAELFGEGRGRPCFEVTHRRSQECPGCPASETFADGQRRVLEETGVDRSGRPVHYLVQLTPLCDADGAVQHVAAVSTDLTATRWLQREYQTLFDKVPCYVTVVNRDLRVVRANERFRETFGAARGEHCYALFKGRHEPCENCPVLMTFEDGRGHTSRHVGVAASGATTHYVVSTEPLQRDGGRVSHVIEMALDITEEHRLHEELALANFLRQALVENTPEAIVVVNAERRVVVVNRAAEVLLGRSREQLLGRRVPPGLVPAQARGVFFGRRDHCVIAETEIEGAGGERIPVRLTGVALRHAGEQMGAAFIARDLRERKRLEREKLDAERLAAVGQTVAGLAHGIKNILTGLEGGMYVTSTSLTKGDQRRVHQGWEMLERNMGRISTLVKNLLAFSRGDEPKPSFIDPAEVVAEVVELYRDSAEQHGVSLDAAIARVAGPAAMDREGLHTCLANLVSNALDACLVAQAGGCRVRVALREEEGALVFEVADSGCGMDYDVKQRAFTSFFTTKGAGGTGLGLLITRKIVQQHGGSVTFESTPAEGTVFRLRFPRNRLPQVSRAEGADKGEGARRRPRRAAGAKE